MLAGAGDARRAQQVVERALHARRPPRAGARARAPGSRRRSGRIAMRGSCSTARPMASPGVEAHALQPQRQQADAFGRRGSRRAATRSPLGDQLGQHHGDGLQRLDLVLGVVARRAVLHHQHAEHPAAAQDRHAHQRVVDLLAGLRPIGEVGMALRVGERQRPGCGGDVADQALADPQPGAVHRLGLQALGGEQLEHLAGAHDVGRADLGHHVGGDDADDLVEPLLARVPPPAMSVAQAAEQQPGAGRTAALGAHQSAGSGGAGSAGSRAASAAHRLADQLVEDLGGRLLAGHHADALAGHQRAALDIAVDHRAAQRAGPEMLDLELRRLLVELAAAEAVDDLALGREEALGRLRWRARAPGSPESAGRAGPRAPRRARWRG